MLGFTAVAATSVAATAGVCAGAAGIRGGGRGGGIRIGCGDEVEGEAGEQEKGEEFAEHRE